MCSVNLLTKKDNSPFTYALIDLYVIGFDVDINLSDKAHFDEVLAFAEKYEKATGEKVRLRKRV